MDDLRYQCFHCNGALCWDNDYTFDEYGAGMIDENGKELDGIVHILHCMECGANVEYLVPIKD